VGFHTGDHLIGGVEGAISTAFFEIFLGFIKPGVDDAALLRGVFVVRSESIATLGVITIFPR